MKKENHSMRPTLSLGSGANVNDASREESSSTGKCEKAMLLCMPCWEDIGWAMIRCDYSKPNRIVGSKHKRLIVDRDYRDYRINSHGRYVLYEHSRRSAQMLVWNVLERYLNAMGPYTHAVSSELGR